MNLNPFNLTEKFVVLSPDKTATPEPVNLSLYQKLDNNYNGFKGHELIAIHDFTEDWNSWEMHPNGDELVVLMSGEVSFVFELEGTTKSIDLSQAGSCLIVPQGVWHTAKVQQSAQVLFITPGEGTQNRDAALT